MNADLIAKVREAIQAVPWTKVNDDFDSVARAAITAVADFIREGA